MTLVQIAIKNLLRRKSKMMFVLLGLVIGITTIVSVYSILDTMKTDMTRQMAEYGANLVLTADSGEITFTYGGINIPEVLYDVKKLTMNDVAAIEKLPSRSMIRVISPKVFGLVQLKGQNIIVTGSYMKNDFSLKPWFKLQEESDQTVKSDSVSTGSEVPEKLDLTRKELGSLPLDGFNVILGAVTAQNLGLTAGDTFELNQKTFTVVGILSENASAEDNQVMMNIDAAQVVLQRTGEVNVIELGVDYNLGSEDTLLSEISAALPKVKITSLRQVALGQDVMLSRLTRFGFTVSILVLLIGMLVVALTMSAAVRERTREIGIFRAIGFRKAHIAKIIVMEGCIISMIGGFIGYFAGMGVSVFAVPLLADKALRIQWHPLLFLGALLLSVLIGVLASLYPARQATRLDPVDALRFI